MMRDSAWYWPRSRYHAPVPATQDAPVRNEASSICGKRTQTTGLKMIAAQSSGANCPFTIAYPTGTCIQLLLTMIQKAENVVPSATIAVENR
jgi:hypothetical protein